MAAKQLPPAEYLRQCFSYDPETGALTWKHRPREHFQTERVWNSWNIRYAGTGAGALRRGQNCLASSYIRIKLNRRTCFAHRIVYAMEYGAAPEGEIDHIDCDGTNNRISNLRPATPSQNMRNRRSQRTGRLKGAYSFRSRWRSVISHNDRNIHLGLFDTEELAHEAYCRAAVALSGEFARVV